MEQIQSDGSLQCLQAKQKNSLMFFMSAALLLEYKWLHIALWWASEDPHAVQRPLAYTQYLQSPNTTGNTRSACFGFT